MKILRLGGAFLNVRWLVATGLCGSALSAAAGTDDEPTSAAREATRDALIREVSRSWRRPEYAPPADLAAGPSAPNSAILRRLEAITLPTVNFTRVPLGQALAALSAAAEEADGEGPATPPVNLVLLDPGEHASEVTLALRDVTLARVMDLLARATGFEYEVQPDAVLFRPESETPALETAFFPVARATVLRMAGRNPDGVRSGPGRRAAESEPLIGDAETAALKRFLQLAGVGFDHVPGASLAYDGSAMIVTQTKSNLERVRTILARYRVVRQVEIEAKFMEVREGALEELGLNWRAATRVGATGARAQAVYATGNRALSDAFTSRASSQQGGIVRPEATTIASDGTVITSPELNLPIVNNAPQIPGSTDLAALAGPLASVGAAIGEFDVNAVVRALAQRQGTDLLSAPKVTVLSGNPATITVAQEMRYPQSFGQTQSQVGTGNASGGGAAGVAITAGTPQEFTSRNVGVELRVTPTVEEDDYSISLDLNPKVTEFDGFVEYGGPSIAIAGSTTVTVPSGFYQPIFSVRDIATKVTVWDGATLVMGGLTREEVKKVSDKVPVLGDLPFLGRLFRSKGTTTQKRNLLIFVTASLVNPGGGHRRVRSPENAEERPLSGPGAPVRIPGGP